MVSILFQLILLFVFRSTMSYHVDDFDSTKLTIFGSIQIMGVCSRLVYIGIAPQMHAWHLSTPRFRGIIYSKHVFLLIHTCNCFPIDLKIYMKLKRSISETSIIGNLVGACVGGCILVSKVRSCGTTASNCQAFQKITKEWFQDLWVHLSRYISPLLSEGSILSFGDDLSGGFQKITTLI